MHEWLGAVSWKPFYSKANHKAGAPLGVQHGTLANEVSSIRTFHHEIMGVDLAKIDPLSRLLVKGVKRMSGTTLAPTLIYPMVLKSPNLVAAW